ncbi:glutathione S-transferase C-terminal domain-containing protein [Thermomonospora umbrina]|uniref:Glutathione S-transferase/putative glutathione S-transferase n=1 Tax=Thermomonospora umbrina TaxID=111806 RepID=A0A3D9SGI6_9ACTN|nr:glutathione S-transferase C-terminal domain-containing protein [Thermomonospora umbrina]REE94797.1 glutathione S-transferase/putative glutathione S-transferase [Thermomonospora umbrina]
MTETPVFAGPVDRETYGEYGPGRIDTSNGWNRPRYPFQGRVTADGSSGFRAEPGRYHLYLAWVCPWAQRTAIVRALKGLQDVVTLSYVDDERDGRGWAFRERRGPDPVNGFAFLQEAYEATEPGFPGHLSVPVLWDRVTGSIVSNHFPDITLDLGTAFDAWGDPDVRLYPEELRAEIDELNAYVYDNVNNGPYQVAAAATQADHDLWRERMVLALERLDTRLAERRYLLGDAVTEADVRLWPTLVRFDLLYNPMSGVSERPLTDYPHLWPYARDLYRIPAFRDSTDFSTFRVPRPGFVNDDVKRLDIAPRAADWAAPHGRGHL